MVLHVVVLAEFLAVVVTVIGGRMTANVFQDFFLISLFIQWIALASLAVLCAARRPLNRLPPWRAMLMALLALVCVAFVIGEATVWLLYAVGKESSPRPTWYARFHVQNLVVSAIVNWLALRYFLARHQLLQRTLSEASARSELLRYRIRRHFLFSSMNIIASLTSRAPAKAEAAIEDIADLFRSMLDESKDLAPIHNEITTARKYAKLEKLRLEDRLTVAWEIKSVPRAVKTPVLMLQLLLENAIRYGIEPFTGNNEIGIKIECIGETLHIRVENAKYPTPLDGALQPGSEAVQNLRTRLREHYGDGARLETTETEDRLITEVQHPAFGETA